MPWFSSKEDIERHIAYCDAMAKTAQAFGHTIDAQAWVWKRMGAEDALRMHQPVGVGGTFVPSDCSACSISRDRIDRLEGDLAYSEEVRRCLEQMVGRTTVAKRELREQLNTFKKNRPRERTAQILHRGEGPSAWVISYDTIEPTVAQDARIELSKRAWDVLLEHLDPQTPWTLIEAQLISDAMQLADWLYKGLREQESRIGYGLIPTQVYDILQRHRSKT